MTIFFETRGVLEYWSVGTIKPATKKANSIMPAPDSDPGFTGMMGRVYLREKNSEKISSILDRNG
jgi:hypothetical protein